ncbi:MAG: glycosyltransferase family 39 protein [Bacteroidota bacterium]
MSSHTPFLKPIHVLGLALIVSLGLRLPFVGVTFFSVDEAVSAVAGTTILDGGLPYRDALDHRGPLTYYAYAGLFGAFGTTDMLIIRLAYLGLILLIQAGIFWLGNRLANAWIGAWASLIYGIFSWTNPYHEMWAAHTEWLLTAGSLLAFACLLVYQERKQMSWLVLAGALWGLASLSKQVGILEMGAAGLWLATLQWRKKRWRQLWIQGLSIGLGFGIVVGGMIAYFWSQDAWADWWQYVWAYNTDYYVPEVAGTRRWINSAKLLVAFFLNKPLLLFLLGVIVVRFRHMPWKTQGWLWAWFAGTLLAAMAGGRVFLHYLIPALAPMSLLAALGLQAFWQSRPAWLSLQKALVLAGLGVSISLGTTFYRYGYLAQEDLSITEFAPFVPYLQSESQSNDRLFVWGFAPELYHLSERKPASRFSFCNVLTGHIPAGNEAKSDTRYAILPGVWDTLQQDLSQQWPMFLIDTQPADYRAYGKYPLTQTPLWEWMQGRYQLDQAFHRQHPEAIFHLYRLQP